MKKVKLTISGMHCASCAANVEKSLGKVKGIKNTSISLLTKKGFIEVDDGVSNEEIKKAVSRAGYKLENIEEQ